MMDMKTDPDSSLIPAGKAARFALLPMLLLCLLVSISSTPELFASADDYLAGCENWSEVVEDLEGDGASLVSTVLLHISLPSDTFKNYYRQPCLLRSRAGLPQLIRAPPESHA